MLGIVSAAATAYLLAVFVSAIEHGSFLERDVFLHAFFIVKRASPVLAIAGSIVGALLLRMYGEWPRRRRLVMVVVAGLASIFVAIGIALTYATAKHLHFERRVMTRQFNVSSTERDVRAALGPPTSSEMASEFRFGGNSGECEAVKAAKNLIYIEPGGGSYRVLYFDGEGKFLCNTEGMIHY